MSLLRQTVVARLALLFFGVNILGQPLLIRATYAAEQTPAFNPPWGQTQERVKPPETENQEPLAWCENTRERKRPDGTVESYNDFRVTYTNGTEVRYEYGESRKRWIVIVPGPQGRTRTTYDLTDEKKPTRTVEEPGKKPVTSEWKEAVEALKKKGASLFDPFANRLVRVSYPVSPVPGAVVLEPEQQLLLAATTERPQTPAPTTQERAALNIKPVTLGGPLDPPPVIHLDPGPATTPEKFVQAPVIAKSQQQKTETIEDLSRELSRELGLELEIFMKNPRELRKIAALLGPPPNWDPEADSQGPVTAQPGTTGTPVPQTPGGAINIGSGWASARVPHPVTSACETLPKWVLDRYDELLKSD